MPSPEVALPLKGIRVADFTWVAAGPRATRVLGNFGAEVIKVESANRLDMQRGRPPFAAGKTGVNVSGMFNNVNCDKLGVTLDLKTLRGKELAKKLVSVSDMVVDNFTPGVMERWGLGYADLVQVKPDIIVASMPVMGRTGPRCDYGGFGMGIEGVSGLRYLSGRRGQMPIGTGIAYPDAGPNPRHVVFALLAALYYRKLTGKGQYIELAQYESTVCFTGPAVLEYTANGRVQGPADGRLDNAAPHGAYRCAGDDRWCVIAVMNDDQWAAFGRVVGDLAWTRDGRFATSLRRKENEDELDRLVEEWTRTKDPRLIMREMQAAGVPAGVVQSGKDLLEEDEQLRYNGHYVCVSHPEAGKHRADGVRIKLSKTPGRVARPAPLLGEHNEYVFKGILGLSDAEYDDLLVRGVLY